MESVFMKRMLFNATQQEELRVAIVDGQKLIDIDIESNARELHKSNIYKAVITRIEPSLEACFVNYSEDRHGFLPFKEVARSLFKDGVDYRTTTIKDALTEGQEIMVQVEKEERGNKGAALTTFISLAGRYLVLMPNNPRAGGVSRRVEGEERQELRETMEKLDVPQGMSIIARTAGIGRTVEELQWDLNYLLQLWNAIESAGSSAPGAFLIYHESSLVIRAIRDYFQPDIGEILIDTDEIYEQARQFMSYVMPDMVNRVKRYRDAVPLFSRFQIEHQIESAYSRVVSLPSGGSIVIDHTEALVAIDVNSARSTRGSDIETTAFTTNCEAAEEVARQLRLRDLGGLVVIDFIDMELPKNRREIEIRLKEALRYDRARVQMDKITRFGLMELSRQRLRPSLSEGSHITCPRCNGTGHIRDTESSALQVLRIIEEESMKESSAVIHVQIPVDVAAFLLNEKRSEIMKAEALHQVEIVLIPNKYLETPHYKLERIKHDDPRLEEHQLSYKLAEEIDQDMNFSKRLKEPQKPHQEAIVKNIPEGLPAPVVKHTTHTTSKEEAGFFVRLLGFLGIGATKEKEPLKEDQEKLAGKASRKPKNSDRPRKNKRSDKDEKVKNSVVDADESLTGKTSRTRRNRNEKTERNEERNSQRLDTSRQKTATFSNNRESIELETVESRDDIDIKQTVSENTLQNEDSSRRRSRMRNRSRVRRDSNTDNGAETAVTSSIEITENIEAVPASQENQADSLDKSMAKSKESDKQPRENNRRPRARKNRTTPSEPAKEIDVLKQNESTQEISPSKEVLDTSISLKDTHDVESSVKVNDSIPDTVEEKQKTQSVQTTSIEVENHNAASVDQPVESVQPQLESEPIIKEVKVLPEESTDLDKILKEAGLTMASTDPEKIKHLQELQQQESPTPRPVRRRRKRVVIVNEGPLIQVDTKPHQ